MLKVDDKINCSEDMDVGNTMNLTEVKLSDTGGFHRRNEPLQFGVPLPKGMLISTDSLKLLDGDTSWPLQIEVTARWPDNSIRWLLLHTQVPSNALPGELALVNDADVINIHQAVVLEEKEEHWQITTADHVYWLDRHTGKLTTKSLIQPDQDVNWNTDYRFVGEQSNVASQVVDSVEITRPAGPVLAQFTVNGYWTSDRHPRFQSIISIFQYGGLVKIDYCIQNPHRAKHSGGLWDLGDPGSIYFKELSVTTTCSAKTSRAVLSSEKGQQAIQTSADTPVCLYQDSSGGLNWNSRNHVDKDGKVTTRIQGYEIRHGENQPNKKRLRAQPILSLTGHRFGCTLAMPKFWQNFPSSIKAHEKSLTLGLFPGESGQHYELQGGERKTQTVYLQFSGIGLALDWTRHPIVPVLPAKIYDQAEAFPWFNSQAAPSELDELIKIGIDGPKNFFAKREVIDEYGWRNFGDLFADHETLYQAKDEEPLISHYNNQYDAIYGFARQFALTGERRWFELMEDLAHHVTDIDIYHTKEDRAEYNNGLFWHTDHYLPANTATHRTFTRHNNTSSTPGQTGGGPAAEHCYTSGLTAHYFLTGQTASRQAVIELAGWMITLHDGEKGLLARLWSIKKDDMLRLKKNLKSQSASPYRYPFTRGTGNYLTALVDAFEVTADQYYLDKTEAVIRGTLHPKDDIERRALLNVELSWSYLVLLTSLERFLAIKKQARQCDDGFYYAQAAFLHYTNWMRQNELPFLADPEKLEFPNDTWVAQDIRKAMLMFQAAELSPGDTEQYRKQGEAWLDEVIDRLKLSQTCHFSRIQVILLQSYGPHGAKQEYESLASAPRNDFGQAPLVSTFSAAHNMFTKVVNGLVEFRPRREKAWLKARLNRS